MESATLSRDASNTNTTNTSAMGVRTQGQMRWSADPPGKMDEKLKSENMQKEHFSEWGMG